LEARIDAGSLETRLEYQFLINELRYKIRQRETEPCYNDMGFVAVTVRSQIRVA